MEHEKVVEIVAKWLQKRHLSPKVIATDDFMPDILVYTDYSTSQKMAQRRHLQVECKKSKDDMYQALGQCLWYYTHFDSLFTYLALPEDFPKDKLRDLQKILNLLNLPIGVLNVYYDENVEEIMPARGKEVDWEFSKTVVS